ncbi:putative glycosyl hydrolase family 71 [Lyophyllum shimeji]|uniref:Glycosyl hydrolase family 71 n=1 Tax=Lyophyllum shimeji TaxID=47721 RepID=A0A9P3PMS5_LYOSH|nr:putative glycosyl hydrolase family 71 [Lyophyllum shimeji]
MAARNSSSKYVVAHHMVGNTYPYTVQDWADDITLAHASGIDGFALNIGKDSWQPDRISDAYEAASRSGLDFKLFISLDMTSLPCATPSDAQALRKIVAKYISHPHQLQIDSRAMVSSFSGEKCTFGRGNAPDGWKSEVTGHPDLQGKIHFVPSFFIDPATFGSFRGIMDGDFNWNAAWPIQLTTDYVRNMLSHRSVDRGKADASEELSLLARAGARIDLKSARIQNALSRLIGSTDPDTQHLEQLGALTGGLSRRSGTSKPTYMAPVSPWFFTHYGADSFNKNFVYLSDQHLYAKRWESLIKTRDQVDIVQILTWNDYGESHYIGPIKGAQPNSQAWVDGMDHTGWLALTQYYATAFKTGSFPAVKTDKLVMWSRTHPTYAKAPDPVSQPTNFELFEDAVWVVVMTTAPSTVVLSTSPINSETFQVPAGLTKLSIPIAAGGKLKGMIARGGKTLVTLNPEKFAFQANPKTYNFNAFVAST